MSAAAQVVVVVIAATVLLARLMAALYRAHADGRIAARQEPPLI
jgi:hypothetical protein